MKTFFKTGLILLALALNTDVLAQTSKPITPLKVPRSTFIQPLNSSEGRDPFYPESTRVFESAHAAEAQVETTTTLVVNGYSVANGRPVVIINQQSFMTGDEVDLPTTGGGRTHVHCLEIRSDSVVVEINGARREIHF